MGKKEKDREEIMKLVERLSKWPTERLVEHLKLTLLEPAEKAIKQILKDRGI